MGDPRDDLGEDVDRCGHGVSFDEDCEDCEGEDAEEYDDDPEEL